MSLSTYPVYCWTYFPIEASYPGMVKNWVDLGINHPLTPLFGVNSDKAKLLALLDECAAQDISPILNIEAISSRSIYELTTTGDFDSYREKVRKAVEDFGRHPAAYGFFVTDEPDAPDATATFRAARIMTEEAPHLHPYLNLLPWFDWIGKRMGTDTLANYLDRCIAESDLREIGYDCYTQAWKGDSGWDVYFNNLREYQALSQRSGVVWNTTLLCANHYQYELHGQADYRWQISTAAAMGAKGISWFYPDAHAGFSENYRDWPINPFCERTLTFAWMGDEMRMFHHQFGDTFMSLDIERAAFTKKSYGGIPLHEGDDQLTSISADNDVNLLLSFFHDKEGVRHLAVVNVSRTENSYVSFRFPSNVKPERKTWNGWSVFGNYSDAVGAQSADRDSTAGTHLSAGQLMLVKLAEAV